MSGLKPTSTDVQDVEQHLGAEQSQDLAALQAMVGGTQEQGTALVEQVPEGPGLANELEGAISMAVGIMGPLFPTVVGIYTPEVTKAVSGSVAAVCEKHGWLQDGLMGRYGEEIACMAVVGPVAFATYKAVQTDIAARQPAQPASVPGEINLSAPVPVDAPGAKTVSVGVAV